MRWFEFSIAVAFLAFAVLVLRIDRQRRPGFPTCLGCTKGRMVPDCPVHDAQERKA